MNEIITPFTYSNLPPPISAEVKAATTRIKDRLTRQVKDIRYLAELLAISDFLVNVLS